MLFEGYCLTSFDCLFTSSFAAIVVAATPYQKRQDATCLWMFHRNKKVIKIVPHCWVHLFTSVYTRKIGKHKTKPGIRTGRSWPCPTQQHETAGLKISKQLVSRHFLWDTQQRGIAFLAATFRSCSIPPFILAPSLSLLETPSEGSRERANIGALLHPNSNFMKEMPSA